MIFGVTMLAVISPGADFAMVTRQSCLHGRSAGLLTATGIALAVWGHVALAMMLVSSLHAVIPGALWGLRCLGAAYLGWIGVSIWRHPGLAHAETQGMTPWDAFRTGFWTNALNPKTALFIMSLFAATPHVGFWPSLRLGALISACHFGWFALLATILAHREARSRVIRHIVPFNRAVGLVLILLAGVLLVGVG